MNSTAPNISYARTHACTSTTHAHMCACTHSAQSVHTGADARTHARMHAPPPHVGARVRMRSCSKQMTPSFRASECEPADSVAPHRGRSLLHATPRRPGSRRKRRRSRRREPAHSTSSSCVREPGGPAAVCRSLVRSPAIHSRASDDACARDAVSAAVHKASRYFVERLRESVRALCVCVYVPCACACACVWACVCGRACVGVCVWACVCVSVGLCLCACVCVSEYECV